MTDSPIELLAPAKDLHCGLAAINHGADAVYIGGPQFSAREAAANSVADIEKLVSYAHQFGARVYVAMNTLFSDRELETAVGLAHELHDIGVDALIIQDVGLLEAGLPPMALHSSTQMNNRTPEKIRFLEMVGFQQVVLARELSLPEIRSIRNATSVALEFFVHGALCVSYSGQCYISEVEAKRSANRGQCAQFCRHCYTLRDLDGKVLARDRYLLSLKDLDMSAHLLPLIEAGISSLKIEGRLKNEIYVKNITAYYRQALDTLLGTSKGFRRASAGKCTFTFTPDPERTFHRGKTDYYIAGGRRRPAEIRSPKSVGKVLGRVTVSAATSFYIDTDDVVVNGDGLCFFDGNNNLVGLRVNRVDGMEIFPREPVQLPVGSLVYRNGDVDFHKRLTASQLCRSLEINVHLHEDGDGLRIQIVDEDAVLSVYALKVKGVKAEQAGKVIQLAEKQIRRTGGTVFIVNEVRVNIDPDIFFPAAVFNQLRREGLAHHLEVRRAIYKVKSVSIQANDVPWPGEKLDYRDNVANKSAVKFYLRHGVKHIDTKRLQAVEVAEADLMTTKYCLRAQLDLCPRENSNIVSAETLLLNDNAGEYLLDFDCRRCEMILRRRLS